MENASKALLIAGSVLIVILLIAFGMKIFNSTSGSADEIEGTMQTAEMAMFNNKFLPYVGTNKTKADVMSLVNIVNSSNATSHINVSLDIKINGVGNTTSAPNVLIERASSLLNTNTYSIRTVINTNGYISYIEVK